MSEALKSYYDQQKRSITKPTPEQSWEILKNQNRDWSRVFIIIDALDECSNEDGTRRRILEGILSLQSSKTVNVIVTSRPIPTILSEFETSTHLEIRASRTDIQTYLEAQTDRFSKRVLAEKDL